MSDTIIIKSERERPEGHWHAHGTFSTTVLIVDLDGSLVSITLIKQRWLNPETGRTCHNRPGWNRPHALYAYDIVFAVLFAWLGSGTGLHRATWPWNTEQPSRRTAQRMLAALRPKATCWLTATRHAITQCVAPRPVEEILLAEGIPPPRGCTQGRNYHINDEISEVSWLLKKTVQILDITMRTLLNVVRRSMTKLCDKLL